MASTRNNNTPGDYCLQQRQFKLSKDYNEYVNSQWGAAYKPAMPCLGITPSHMSRDTLSNNSIDIESCLFGINSTNLVNPQPAVKPQLKTIPMQSYFQKTPLIMPKNLVVYKNQRPFPIPE